MPPMSVAWAQYSVQQGEGKAKNGNVSEIIAAKFQGPVTDQTSETKKKK